MPPARHRPRPRSDIGTFVRRRRPVTGSATAAAMYGCQKPRVMLEHATNFGPTHYLLRDRPAGCPCHPRSHRRRGGSTSAPPVETVSRQRRMPGVATLPAVNSSLGRPRPSRIGCVAPVADPFRPELPTLAAEQPLHQQLLLLQSAQYGADKPSVSATAASAGQEADGSGCRRAAQANLPNRAKVADRRHHQPQRPATTSVRAAWLLRSSAHLHRFQHQFETMDAATHGLPPLVLRADVCHLTTRLSSTRNHCGCLGREKPCSASAINTPQ